MKCFGSYFRNVLCLRALIVDLFNQSILYILHFDLEQSSSVSYILMTRARAINKTYTAVSTALVRKVSSPVSVSIDDVCSCVFTCVCRVFSYSSCICLLMSYTKVFSLSPIVYYKFSSSNEQAFIPDLTCLTEGERLVITKEALF